MPSPPSPFDAVANGYDQAFTDTATGRLQRDLVQARCQNLHFQPKNVLELNCGTGQDALWLAQFAHTVIATDVSEGMLSVARQKAATSDLGSRIRFARLHAGQLRQDWVAAGLTDATFDTVFSNFGGINCLSPDELAQLNQDLYALMPKGGKIYLVVMGRFCWWETLYFMLKGRWKTAFRRLSRKPIQAALDGLSSIATWYYSPSDLRRVFHHFRPLRTEAIGFWLPPSYLEPFFGRFPRLLRGLNTLERLSRWPFFALGSDHYLMILEKK